MDNYIVYAAFDKKGNCLYVGEGKPDRYKHITSGTSHVYEANRWHFMRKDIVVDILHSNLTKQQAVDIEKKEIAERLPAWNKCEYSTGMLIQMIRHASKRLKKYYMYNPRCASKKDRYLQITKDLCKILDRDGKTTVLQGQLWCSVELPVGFMSHLTNKDKEYYKPLKYVFNFTRDSQAKIYKAELIDWENKN